MKKLVIIMFILHLSIPLFSFRMNWMGTDHYLNFNEFGNDELVEVIIEDNQNTKLEVIKRVDNNFKSNLNDNKITIRKEGEITKISYDTLNWGIHSFYLGVSESTVYYQKGDYYSGYTYRNGNILDFGSNSNFVIRGTPVAIKFENIFKNYYYGGFSKPKFSSSINYINSKDYIEEPYYGLEYSTLEVIEEYMKNGKVDFNQNTYKPYIKNIHTEKIIGGIKEVKDEVYDIGGLCFTEIVLYKSDRVIKKEYIMNPENLNTENPNRINYYDDVVAVYLVDVRRYNDLRKSYEPEIKFNRNHIIINYFYKDDEIK